MDSIRPKSCCLGCWKNLSWPFDNFEAPTKSIHTQTFRLEEGRCTDVCARYFHSDSMGFMDFMLKWLQFNMHECHAVILDISLSAFQLHLYIHIYMGDVCMWMRARVCESVSLNKFSPVYCVCCQMLVEPKAIIYTGYFIVGPSVDTKAQATDKTKEDKSEPWQRQREKEKVQLSHEIVKLKLLFNMFLRCSFDLIVQAANSM